MGAFQELYVVDGLEPKSMFYIPKGNVTKRWLPEKNKIQCIQLFSGSDDAQDAVLLLVWFLFAVSQVHVCHALVASLPCLFREDVFSLAEAPLTQSRCQMAVC